MDKIIGIGGMTCPHCHARVECALNAIPGVKARVDKAAKSALVEISGESVRDDVLMKAILDAGYSITSIKNVK